MSDQFLRLAQVEEATLLAELRRHPAFSKLEAVRALMAAYRVDSASTAVPGPVQQPQQPSSQEAQSQERPGTQGYALEKVSKAYLRRMGRRAPVTEIMEAVLAEGIRMGGAKPISTLSSFLSHHPAFDNVRGEGYGLAEWKGVSPSASGNLLDRSQANPSMTPATTTSDSGANGTRPDDRLVEQREQTGSPLAITERLDTETEAT